MGSGAMMALTVTAKKRLPAGGGGWAKHAGAAPEAPSSSTTGISPAVMSW